MQHAVYLRIVRPRARLGWGVACLLACLLGLTGAASADAREGALVDLASGDAKAAVSALKSAVRAAPAKEKGALRCLLGRAQRLAGQTQAAIATFEAVPDDAECYRRAAFERADALAELGRAEEAAVEYARLGGIELGPERDVDTVAWIESLADRALKDKQFSMASRLYALALTANIGPTRRTALAQRIAQLMVENPRAGLRVNLRDPLVERLIAKDSPAERRLLAGHLSTVDADPLLRALPPEPATLRVLADALTAHRDRRLAVLDRLAATGGAVGQRAADEAVVLRLEAGRMADTPEALNDLIGSKRPKARVASAQRAMLLASTGALAEARTALKTHLARFPSDPKRVELTRAWRQVIRQQAYQAAAAQQVDVALSHFEAYAKADPSPRVAAEVAWAAALVERQAGRLDAAEARLREAIAQLGDRGGADTLKGLLGRIVAFDRDNLPGAKALLKELDGEAEAERFKTPYLAIHTTPQRPGRAATVQVHARNIEQLAARMHAVDLDAYLRTGAAPAKLPELDVGVIAPDTRWTAKVPDYTAGHDRRFDLTVPTQKPGLYMVTVSAAQREASALLWISSTRIVARMIGADLAVAVFDGDTPAAGAKLKLRGDTGTMHTGKTNAKGLFRKTFTRGQPITILAEHRGAPALLQMRQQRLSEPSDAVRLGARVDRPVYRPGDRVGVRIIARKGDAPLTGTFKLWLAGVRANRPVEVKASAFGTAAAELLIPGALPKDTGEQRSYDLMVQAPGADDGRSVARIAVHPEAPRQRSITLRHAGTEAIVQVREPDGRPAVNVQIGITAPGYPDTVEQRTDARGQVRLAGPPAMVPWQATARILHTPFMARAQRKSRRPTRLELEADDTPTGGRAAVRLAAPDGAYTVRWAPLFVQQETVKPLRDPWDSPIDDTLEGADDAVKPLDITPVALGAVAQQTVTVKGGYGQLDLPALANGHWRIWATPVDGVGRAEATLSVGNARVGLSGIGPVRAGAELAVGLSGARPALVVAGSDSIVEAAVLAPGAQIRWRTDPRWRNAQVHAIDSAGESTSKRATIDPALAVTLRTERRDQVGPEQAAPQWRVVAEVTDGAGRPVPAELSLRIIDKHLLDTGFRPSDSAVTMQIDRRDAAISAAVVAIKHHQSAAPISAALLAEVKREESKKRARQATQGRFDSPLGAVLRDAPLEDQSLDGVGVGGFGRGGGGMGRGRASPKVRTGRAIVMGARPHGEQARVLWAVRRTDAQGRVQIDVDRPARPSTWRLDALAVNATAQGTANTELSTHTDTRLSVATPAPGNPGDTVTPLLAVRHGGAQPAKVSVRWQGTDHAVVVPPGEGALLAGKPLQAGASGVATLAVNGARMQTTPVAFALQAGAPDAKGRVVTVAAGPGGTPPTTWLALRGADRWQFADHAARAGLAAHAALPGATPAQRATLEARITAAHDALAILPTRSNLERASVLRFMATVRDRFAIPRGELEMLSGKIGNPGTDPTARIAVLYARALAGLKVDDSVIGRLKRAELTDEQASQFARALITLKRVDAARPFVRGDGPHAVLARRALGQRAAAQGLGARPPAMHDPALADWIAAVVERPKAGRGVATVRLGDRVVGQIDRAQGGAVQVVTADTPTVDGLSATLWRANPAPAEGASHVVARIPRTVHGGPLRGDIGRWPDAARPLVLAVGDALALLHAPPAHWQPPAGLTRIAPRRLQAMMPGVIQLQGLTDGKGAPLAPLQITVEADPKAPTALSQTTALALAEEAVATRRDPLRFLAPWPDDTAWTTPSLAARRAQVRFDHALRTQAKPADLVDAFEALREAKPKANLDFAQVRQVAEAYQQAGAAPRALNVWRAGLGGAFLAEAGLVRRVEDIGGVVASLEGLRRLAQRYPSVPPVAKTTFLLPQRLDELAANDTLPRVLTKAGVTHADLRLQAAGWDREFLALHPDSKVRPQAAFHLVQTLQALNAHKEAARWGRLLGDQHQASPEYDGILYLEGLSRLRLREDDRALKIFERLSTGEFPQADGSTGPAGTRDDARYALARLYEARGDLKKAQAAYEAAASTHADAADSAEALKAVRLHADKFVRVSGRDRLALPVQLANLEILDLRAYRLDLRTVFLRDSGLDNVHAVKVSGVSPAWSGTIEVPRDPFPTRRKLALPLDAPGAYLVQIEAGGQRATSLVVRTDLSLDVMDGRVRVRLKGNPAAGIGLRAAGGGDIDVATTDVRGVARVDGDAVLAFTDTGHVAFTRPAAWQPTRRRSPRRPMRNKKRKSKSNVQQRLQQQIEDNRRTYEKMYDFDDDSIDAELL